MSGQQTGKTSKAPWAEKHIWQIQPIRDTVWIALVVLLWWIGYQLRGIFTPMLIALVFAYISNPLVDACQQRWNVPRVMTIVGIIVLVLVVLVGLALWLGPVLWAQLDALIEKAPDYVQALNERYDLKVGKLDEQVVNLLEEVRTRPLEMLKPVFAGTSQAFGFIGNVVGATFYVILMLILIPVYYLYFAWHFHPAVRQVQDFIPNSGKDTVLKIAGRMDRAVATFFRVRMLIAMIMSILFAIGWCPLVADVPYWLLLSLITGVLSLIPYAAGIGWLLAVGLKAMELATTADITGSEWLFALAWPTLVYFGVQALEGWLLTPWLQGYSMEISPLAILIVVILGGAMAGLYGMILAVPVAACGKIFIREVLFPRLGLWAREN